MPAHHSLDAYLQAYLAGAGLADDKKGTLSRSAIRRSGVLSNRPLTQADVYRMIGQRTLAAGIETDIGCHSFRATGITEYMRNGGNESARVTGLYDLRDDDLTLDEIERILIWR